MNRLTKKIENEERYIANSIKREHGERLLTAIARYDKKVYNKLGRFEDLEEELGCPLEVRCKVVYNTSIFAEQECGLKSNEWLVDQISSVGFKCWQEYASRIHFWKDYKKTWWLKKDKSE